MHDQTSSPTLSVAFGPLSSNSASSSLSSSSSSDDLSPLFTLSYSPRITTMAKKRSHQDLPHLSIPFKPQTSRASFPHLAHGERSAGQDAWTLESPLAVYNSQAGPETPSSASTSTSILISPSTPISPVTSIPTSISTPTSTSTPETPNSLSSPIVGVVDLTRNLKTVSSGPVSHGGYSDIYQGELEMTKSDQNSSFNEEAEKIPVAIKLLRVLSSKGYDEVKARKRLNREVYVWHRLDHPNIATFLGTSYHMANRPSLILPWFKNGSASEYLRLKNPGADRLRLILDVAEGLEYLHTCKPAPIVHGDLKGNNILITDSGHATLSDFGLSQVIEDLVCPTGITPSKFEAGPIRWQSPEFLTDVSETCRPQLPGDVWSFGCTAYELLTGNVPYHFRRRDSTVIHDIQAGIPPPGVEENSLHRGDGGIWDLMNDCWIYSPVERIHMTEVVLRLGNLCSRSSCGSSSSAASASCASSCTTATSASTDVFIAPADKREQ